MGERKEEVDMWEKKEMRMGRIEVPGLEGDLYDFSRGAIRWGWHMSAEIGGVVSGHGLDRGDGFVDGDWVILDAEGGGKTLCRLSEVRYETDPKDMFRARLRHVALEPVDVVEAVFAEASRCRRAYEEREQLT